MEQGQLLKDTSRKRTILIIDDIPRNIEVLAHILVKENYYIIAALNGRQAFKIIAHRLPDLVLLDIQMPEMDGFEICKKLKKSSVTRDIPIIFLTAKTDSKYIVKGFELGAVDYVTKPFRAPELLARVRTHIELKDSKKAQQELIQSLRKALEDVGTLKQLIPVCVSCKKVRDDEGYWKKIEEYFYKNSDYLLSHGLCPECAEKLYPDIYGDSEF